MLARMLRGAGLPARGWVAMEVRIMPEREGGRERCDSLPADGCAVIERILTHLGLSMEPGEPSTLRRNLLRAPIPR